MHVRIACLAVAALAASGCEHPFANAGLRGGPAAAPAAVLHAAPATDGEHARAASDALQALLGEHAAISGRGSLPAGSDQPQVLASASWLEAQSAALRTLAERSRAARLTIDAGHP